jgi:arylsulfatase A-like enzyme
LSWLVLVPVLFCTAARAADRPNVLFIAVDDMCDWVGHLGATPRAITPNIDRLAARGVSFSNAHTAGVYCAPSRAAIFTGQYASTTGNYANQVYFADHPELRPLHVSFTEAGYETFGTGKLFHHPEGQVDLRGWTEFHVRNAAQKRAGWPLDSWGDDTPKPEPYPYSRYNRGKTQVKGHFLEWGPTPDKREEELADTRRAAWAAKKVSEPRDKPFFVGVGFYAPHYPNYCPQKYFDLYKTADIPPLPLKADDIDDLPEKVRRRMANRSKIRKRLVELGAVKDALHGYLACVSYADAMIGRVLDALERGPHAEDTIVVLWSDHGYHHGEKGQWGKHTLWERTSNVPFVWAGPGVARGKMTDVTVSLIDMYPTFVELCGLQRPAHRLEGVSLASTLRDPASARDRDVYLPYIEPDAYAIMNRDWRYIRYADGGEELYDLRKDPNEWHNLAGKGHDEVVSRLRRAAPTRFAKPGPIRRKKDLIVEGETFRWE